MEDILETNDGSQVDVIDVIDLGNALVETRQVVFIPIVFDSLLGLGIPG